MTYLNWGCDTLADECGSCLDALCNVCTEEFKKKHGKHEDIDILDTPGEDSYEPDCEDCDLEKKPDCAHCEIILNVCLKCTGNKTCEFKICG